MKNVAKPSVFPSLSQIPENLNSSSSQENLTFFASGIQSQLNSNCVFSAAAPSNNSNNSFCLMTTTSAPASAQCAAADAGPSFVSAYCIDAPEASLASHTAIRSQSPLSLSYSQSVISTSANITAALGSSVDSQNLSVSTNISQFMCLFANIFDLIYVPNILNSFAPTQPESLSSMKIVLNRQFLFSDFSEKLHRSFQQHLQLPARIVSSVSNENPSASFSLDHAFDLFLESSRKLGFSFL